MTLFPWARYKRAKHAIKLHTLLDLREPIPSFVRITPAQVHDVNLLDQLTPEPARVLRHGSWVPGFPAALRALLSRAAFFVTRARKNFRCSPPGSLGRSTRAPAFSADQTIALVMILVPPSGYPAPLRRVCLFRCRAAAATGVSDQQFLPCRREGSSPSFTGSAGRSSCSSNGSNSICVSRRSTGNSENAVKTQIWTALCSLPAGGHRPKAACPATELVRHAANYQRERIRENPNTTGLFA